MCLEMWRTNSDFRGSSDCLEHHRLQRKHESAESFLLLGNEIRESMTSR